MGIKILINMKRISSKLTYLLKRIVPIIILINIMIVFVFLTFFDFTFKELSLLIYPTIIFSIAWLDSFRKLKQVYLGENFLIVNEKKIHFNNIIDIERKALTKLYKVTYQDNKLTKTFIFRPNFIILFEPDDFKVLRKFPQLARASRS